MKKKLSTLLVLATISAIGLTSLNDCAASTTATETTANKEDNTVLDNERLVENRGVLAKVTAIDGSRITVVESSQMGRGGKGDKAELPEGTVEGEKPELPEGAIEGEKPEITFDGETKTIDIDTSILFLEG